MKRSQRQHPDVLHYRGVDYQLPVELDIGQSFFLPTLRPKGVFTLVEKHYRGRAYRLTWEERIERALLGIRVWRVL